MEVVVSDSVNVQKSHDRLPQDQHKEQGNQHDIPPRMPLDSHSSAGPEGQLRLLITVISQFPGTLEPSSGPPAQRVSARPARGGGHLSRAEPPSIRLPITTTLQFILESLPLASSM